VTVEERSLDRLQEHLGSDTQRHVRMLSLLAKTASILGSMQWELVSFGSCWLQGITPCTSGPSRLHQVPGLRRLE